ncbi:uncharacterized protein [Drosophila kikkawai]|uniref:Uncharacterized protein isoform X5 n=1 Tax=Drosophila kikkawai TaxID=30033 RepID=A0ABM4G9B4_DROKI
MEIVDLSNVTQCSLPKGTSPNADEYCSLVTNTLSCGLFVNLIDFMKIFFCKFKLSVLPVYGLCNVFMLVGLFSLLHMMTKYFFFPNLVTLIEFAPMTQFGFSYLFFAPCLLMPYYTSAWPTCSVKVEKLSRLQFAKLIGDAMRHFLTGIMVLCVRGYKVEGVTLWSCIIFMMLGILYLTLVSNRKHHIHADNMESSKHLVLLELRVLAFILIFCIVLITILAVSYSTFARNKLPKKEKHGSFSDMESDDEILGSYPKQRIYSRRHIWLQTVNGNRIMRDSHVVYRFLMVGTNLFRLSPLYSGHIEGSLPDWMGQVHQLPLFSGPASAVPFPSVRCSSIHRRGHCLLDILSAGLHLHALDEAARPCVALFSAGTGHELRGNVCAVSRDREPHLAVHRSAIRSAARSQRPDVLRTG